MIKSNSALLHIKTRHQVLRDLNRGRVISALRNAAMSPQDIATALNCSESLTRTLLMVLIRPSMQNARQVPDISGLRYASRHERSLMLYRRPRTPQGIARERERLAGHLSREIQRWLMSFELTAGGRQDIIDHAAFRLDQTPLSLRGEYIFSTERSIEELLGLWKPNSPRDEYLHARLGRWLASWIRFWISDPQVWNRALALVSLSLGEEDQTQAA